MEPQIQLPSTYSSAPSSQRVKAERLAGPSIEQALHLRHRRVMDCRKIRAFGKKVSDEAIPVFVHPAFPCVIGGGKDDLDAQGFEPMHCRTMRRLGRGSGQPRRR